MTLQIETNRGIAAQILRHRSFTFQEFSQRYADASLLSEEIPPPRLRRQDEKNRQNSIDDIDPYVTKKYDILIKEHFKNSMSLYNRMLDDGIAKECARFVLPLSTPTKIYMTGSVRSWIHYINLRSAHGTQLEHLEIAELCRRHFICNFPSTSKALDWCPEEDCDCKEDAYSWGDTQRCLRID